MRQRWTDPAAIEAEIARIRSLALDALRRRWRAVFGRTPPAALSKDLLGRMIAFRLQEQAFGGLDIAARNAASIKKSERYMRLHGLSNDPGLRHARAKDIDLVRELPARGAEVFSCGSPDAGAGGLKISLPDACVATHIALGFAFAHHSRMLTFALIPGHLRNVGLGPCRKRLLPYFSAV